MSAALTLRVLLFVLTLAALAAACALEAYGLDSREAWAGFAAGLGSFLGLHIPAPPTGTP